MSARARRPSPSPEGPSGSPHGRPIVAAAAALQALLLLAPGCGPSPVPPPGSAPHAALQFTYPLPIEPSTLNFVSGTDQASVLVQRLVGEGLVDHDPDMRPVPSLARSWDFSSDGRVLTFRLRSGVRFHDGTPFTSRDVAFTYERLVDPRSRAVGRIDAFLPVERVETPDASTVRVVYRVPYAPALGAWEAPILPAHLYDGADFAASPHDRAPIGTGPFRFVAWEPGRRIVLAANPDHWRGRPAVDRFVFAIIPSQETALQALLAGEVDFARLTPVQWEAHRDSASFARRFRLLRYLPLFHYYIAWRSDGSNPFFADPTVRRALTLALDREGYVRSVLRGLGETSSSPFHPMVPGAGPPLPAIPYDPRGAALLLDRAGWRLDANTGLRKRHGAPFSFTLLIYGAGEDHVQFAQVAQENLRRVGIEMAIQRLDWQSLLTRLRRGDFEAALSGTIPGTDPDAVYGMLHSSQIDGGQNYAAFSDREIDAWLEQGRRTLDPDARRDLYHRVNLKGRDLEPYSFLFYPAVQAAVAARIDGVRPSPTGILGSYPGAAGFRAGAGAP